MERDPTPLLLDMPHLLTCSFRPPQVPVSPVQFRDCYMSTVCRFAVCWGPRVPSIYDLAPASKELRSRRQAKPGETTREQCSVSKQQQWRADRSAPLQVFIWLFPPPGWLCLIIIRCPGLAHPSRLGSDAPASPACLQSQGSLWLTSPASSREYGWALAESDTFCQRDPRHSTGFSNMLKGALSSQLTHPSLALFWLEGH